MATLPVEALDSRVRDIGGKRFDFDRQVAVMAIVNRTPDSFYDLGSTFSLDAAVVAALKAVEAGADWVDVGGVPFGKGPEVSVEEEAKRIFPLVTAIRERSDVVISVDTTSAVIASGAIAAGASVINDTSGLWDPDMAGAVAESDATLILTHSIGPPRSEPRAPKYSDVVSEVKAFLEERVARAVTAGVPLERLVVDPGHDLNKNTLHSLDLVRRLNEIVEIGLPTLVAVSNKDFVGESINRRPKHERLEGSLAAMVACIMNGARIVRMHNVRETVDAVRMTEVMLGMHEPAYLRHSMGWEEKT